MQDVEYSLQTKASALAIVIDRLEVIVQQQSIRTSLSALTNQVTAFKNYFAPTAAIMKTIRRLSRMGNVIDLRASER